MSVSTGCAFPYPLAISLPWFAAAGFEGIELVLGPRALGGAAAQVRRQVERAELRVFSVHPPFFKTGVWRNEGASAPRQVELTAELGAELTLIHPPTTDRWESPAAVRYLRGLDEAQERAQRLGVRLALETAGRRWHGDSRRLLLWPAALRRFAEERGLEWVLDVAHVGSLDLSLEEATALLGPGLAGVHLSDMAHGHEEWRRGSMGRFASTHQMPGEGVLPLGGFFRRLAAAGFDGLMTLEVSPLHLGAWNPWGMVRRLRQAAVYVEEQGAVR